MLPALDALADAGIAGAAAMAERAARWLAAAQRPGWRLERRRRHDVDGAGAPTLAASIEETAQAVAALAAHAGAATAPPTSCRSAAAWPGCATATDDGRRFPAAPIGLYFARLWYSEALYPLIFTVAAIQAAERALGRSGRSMIYLDAHATTPVDPRVLDAMLPYLRDQVGNASSLDHAAGRRTRDAVEAARRQVAALIGASHKDIVFTSGATEADNLAIKGVVERRARSRRPRRDASPPSTAPCSTRCRRLEARGCRVTVPAGRRRRPRRSRRARGGARAARRSWSA